MAQVKYLLPRLVGKGDALSRLMGGIGGRGPGESKLEIDRRRLRERLHRLQQDLGKVREERRERRQPRQRQRLQGGHRDAQTGKRSRADPGSKPVNLIDPYTGVRQGGLNHGNQIVAGPGWFRPRPFQNRVIIQPHRNTMTYRR